MPTVVDCRYRRGGAEARFAIRDIHLTYMIRRRSEVHFGGASTHGAFAIGMLLVLVTDDPAEARAFIDEEPYHCAGLFESISFTRFDAFIPEPHAEFLNGLLVAARPVAEQLRAVPGDRHLGNDRQAPLKTEGEQVPLSSARPSRIRCTIDLDAPTHGLRWGRLLVPHSRQSSAYGQIAIPIAIITQGAGPRVLLTGGTHGDEYEGQLALLQLVRDLDPNDVSGQLIVIPALNLPASMAGQRCSPIDAGNLNRCFPGDPDGSVTQMLAHFVESVLLARVSHFLDIHSGGTSLEYLPGAMAAPDPDDPSEVQRATDALLAFGAPTGFVFKTLPDDRTTMAASRRQGVFQLAAEIGGGGGVTFHTLAVASRGVRNFLSHVGVWNVPLTRGAASCLLASGDVDDFVVAMARGLFAPTFELGQTVEVGTVAGAIHFPDEPERAPVPMRFAKAGMVIARRTLTACEPGDILVQVGQSA